MISTVLGFRFWSSVQFPGVYSRIQLNYSLAEWVICLMWIAAAVFLALIPIQDSDSRFRFKIYAIRMGDRLLSFESPRCWVGNTPPHRIYVHSQVIGYLLLISLAEVWLLLPLTGITYPHR